ncbi:hypothetical protein ACFLR4_00095 [Bacteroidota bacterium]
MKKLKSILLFSLVSIFITGCIEYNVKVKVNPNGSGTVRETVILGSALVDILNAFADWDDEGEELDLYNEDELKQQAYEYGEGVEFVEGKRINDKGREGYTATYRFNDITKVRIEDDPDKKVPSDFSMEEVEEEQPITFGFNEGDFSTITINLPDEFDPEDFNFDFDEENVEIEDREEFEDMLKDLRISIKIEVNGYILETNAAYVDDSEITLMEFDMGEILDDPEKFDYLKNKKPQTKEEAKELLEEILGLKVELETKVDIKFK